MTKCTINTIRKDLDLEVGKVINGTAYSGYYKSLSLNKDFEGTVWFQLFVADDGKLNCKYELNTLNGMQIKIFKRSIYKVIKKYEVVLLADKKNTKELTMRVNLKTQSNFPVLHNLEQLFTNVGKRYNKMVVLKSTIELFPYNYTKPNDLKLYKILGNRTFSNFSVTIIYQGKVVFESLDNKILTPQIQLTLSRALEGSQIKFSYTETNVKTQKSYKRQRDLTVIDRNDYINLHSPDKSRRVKDVMGMW